jgi:predicted nucleotidyltransferase
MRTESNHPTPYSDVNEILTLLLKSVQEILGNQLVGMYLYGSLSSGDFDPQSSDIDFLVVTTSTLSDKAIAELRSMHQRIWKSSLKWSSKLEGSYIPKRDIRRHDPHSPPCPTVNEGKFYLDKRGSDWIIQRHVIREQGIILTGPEPKTLIDPVSPEDIRRAVTGVLQEWWLPMLEDPSWLKNHGSEYHAFAILSMCRALHALEHGVIVSKPVAARWAQKELGERWSQVIEQALARQAGHEARSLYNESLEFIKFTINIVRNSVNK